MNSVRNISSTQIVWAVGLLVGLAAAVVVGSAIGNQNFARVSLIVGAGLGISTILLLGNKYWMLIPFSLAASRLPTIPLGGRAIELPELAITACSVMFFLRLASRKEKLIIWRPASLPILLFTAWVGMVFVLNPVGLAAMGSSVGGARFYVKLGLAFAAFLILSSRTYTERDVRWMLGFILLGAFFTLGYGITSYALTGPAIDAATGMVQDEFYTWHQELNVVAFTAAFLIFARWSPAEVFTLQRAWAALTYAICILLVLFSGKRMGVVAMLIAPLISAIVWRQFVYIFIALGLAFVSLSLLVGGHGQWFHLPLVAQRTISFLPGDWDPELQDMRGGTDDWRAELRHWALQNVKKDPIIGQGFAVDLQETVGAILTQQRGGALDVQVAAYALGRSWHNTWLGYAADFGIPLSVIQAMVYLTVVALSYRCFRYYGNRSPFGVFALFLLIYTVRDILGSHTGGHSALDAWARWWMYGVLVSIYCALPKRKKIGAVRSATQAFHDTARPSLAMPFEPGRGAASRS